MNWPFFGPEAKRHLPSLPLTVIVVTFVVVFFVTTVLQGTNLPLASRQEFAAMEGVAARSPATAAAAISLRIMIALPCRTFAFASFL